MAQVSERYRLATSEIKRLKADCDTHYYDLGTWLVRVADERLFLEGGFDTLNRYLEEEVDFSRSLAFVCMRVVRNFARETAARYGLYKVDAVLAHLAATPEADTPADLANLRFGGKSIDEATTEEILEATRAVRAGAAAKWPPEVAAFVDRFSASMPGVKVAVSMSGEKPKYAFSGVGPEELCDLGRGLLATVPCR